MTWLVRQHHIGAAVLVIGLVLWYVVTPLGINFAVAPDPYLLKLASLAILAVISVVAGFRIALLDSRFHQNATRLHVFEATFQAIVWASFVLFAIIVIGTAKTVPLISALRGATEEALSVERGDFFKTRTGWQASFAYISVLYTCAVLPYATTRLFVTKHRLRFIAVGVFIFYSVLALEKTIFVYALAPLIWLFFTRSNYRAMAVTIVLAFTILFINTVLARGSAPTAHVIHQGDLATGRSARSAQPGFFTISYKRRSALDHIIWRSVVIPVLTARDGLRVFDEKLQAQHLWGATSSFVAKITGQKRLNYDAEVFAFQYGRSAIGHSNAVYIIEAFVNFGWIGVAVFSLFIGQALRWFAKTKDEALRSMWPLFCYTVFNAGLLGTLLSNGYLGVFAFALFGCVWGNSSPLPTRGQEVAGRWEASNAS